MRVKETPLADIKPYENNPRHNDEAVKAVAASIAEFGWKQPIVVDADGVIIVGHTRLKAAQRLGLSTAPVVVADDLTPEQTAAYRLADNKTAELAEWDMDKLALELDGLTTFDMEQFGFDASELELKSETDGMQEDEQSESFTVSFDIPMQHKEQVSSWLENVGKEYVVDMIVGEACQYVAI